MWAMMPSYYSIIRETVNIQSAYKSITLRYSDLSDRAFNAPMRGAGSAGSGARPPAPVRKGPGLRDMAYLSPHASTGTGLYAQVRARAGADPTAATSPTARGQQRDMPQPDAARARSRDSASRVAAIEDRAKVCCLHRGCVVAHHARVPTCAGAGSGHRNAANPVLPAHPRS